MWIRRSPNVRYCSPAWPARALLSGLVSFSTFALYPLHPVVYRQSITFHGVRKISASGFRSDGIAFLPCYKNAGWCAPVAFPCLSVERTVALTVYGLADAGYFASAPKTFLLLLARFRVMC